MMRRLILGCILAIAAQQIQAQESRVAGRIETAFQSWMDQQNVVRGAIAITRNGRVFHTAGVRMDADQPMEMASLAKAVTAVCVLSLVDQGVLGWDTTLGDALGSAYPDMARSMRQLSIRQLITHTAGIGPDGTQEAMPGWLHDPTPRHSDVTRDVLARSAQARPVGAYAYNNEHYAVLGEVIAQATGQSYREICSAHVMPPQDYPSARPSPVAGAFDAWGGWQMTVVDYARFMARHFGPDSRVGDAPSEFPNAPAYVNAYYGLGMVWRRFRGSHNFWHFGALCMADISAGSFAVSWMGEWGVVAAYSDCVGDEAMLALDGALTRAVFAP